MPKRYTYTIDESQVHYLALLLQQAHEPHAPAENTRWFFSAHQETVPHLCCISFEILEI